MSRLVLLLLGPPRIDRDGTPVVMDTRKAVALLAYLAVTGEHPTREGLAALLYPESDTSHARAALRRTLFVLKAAIGEKWLTLDRDGVALRRSAELWCDVEEFQRHLAQCQTHGHAEVETCSACLMHLAEAAALYRDDFLAGFTLSDSAAFDDWLFFQSEGLRRQFATALERLVEGHTALGEYEPAITYARRWLALDSLHEPAHCHLMQLYAASGQQSAALRQYQECVRLLEAELGVPPEEETTALYERIRRGEFKKRQDKGREARGGKQSAREKAAFRTPFSALASSPPLAQPLFLTQDTQPKTAATVFVGRNNELAKLAATFDSARTGQGQLLFVIGGAGRGKTTLVQEFARRAQADDAEVLVVSGDCNAHTGIGDPYLPFLEALTMLVGEVEARWAGGLISTQQARRLWAALPITVPALVEHAPDLIGTFVPAKALHDRAALFAPADARWFSQLATLTAADQSVRLEEKHLFAQYTAVLKAIAVHRPILLILEDLHWVDLASTSLLFHLSRAVGDSRIFLLGTYRPDEVATRRMERHPLADLVGELKRQHGDIWLDLSALAPAAGRQFVAEYLDIYPNQLGAAFREALFQHTEGHALFTVELLRAMQERGDLRQDEAGAWTEGAAIDWQTLPARVEGVIEQRIHRLASELRAVLTVASVEGEVFTVEVVARVQRWAEPDLVQRFSRVLDRQHRLVTAQALEWLGQQRLSRYRFRHHLFQQYLYRTLDEAERAYLHEAVGAALEALYGEQTEQAAVQLAHHFERAGLTEKAVAYLLQAGERAHRLSANQEAIHHLTQGLSLLGALPATGQRARQELTLQIALGKVLMVTQGYALPAAQSAFARARVLSQELGEYRQLGTALYGLWPHYAGQAEFQISRALGEELLRLSDKLEDPELHLSAHAILGITLVYLGELSLSRAHHEQALSLYEPHQHRPLVLRLIFDPGVVSLSYLALSLWLLGYPEQALQRSYASLALARERAQPYSLALGLNATANIHHLRREPQQVRAQAAASMNLSIEQGFPLLLAQAQLYDGWALIEQGQAESGLAHLSQAIAAQRATGHAFGQTHQATLLAKGHLALGQSQRGLDILAQGLAFAVAAGERYMEAELHRLKGELLLSQAAPAAEVEGCFWQAIDLARSQQAKAWELRAGLSLCRFWQGQGKSIEARQLLTETYRWFSEGFDTPDLLEARALLEALP